MKKLSTISVVFLMLILILSSCELSFESYEVYDERNPFTGRFEVEEYSEGSSAYFVYDIRIRKSNYQDGIIWINNLYDSDIRVFAEVDYDQFYIPIQRVGDLEIEGMGTLFNGEELSISYSVREIRPGPDYIDFLNCRAWKHW